MSGAVKSLGKTFKKVVSTAKKILPIALAAGSIFFTAGSALGLTPTLGEAVGGIVGKLGLGETATGALTGAITQAGIGAAIGGAGAAVTGGDFLSGAQAGAVTGAVTGGVSGGMYPRGFAVDPLKDLGSAGRPRDWFAADGSMPAVTPAPNPAGVTIAGRDALGFNFGDAVNPPENAANVLANRPSIASSFDGRAAPTDKPRGFADFFNTQAGAGLVAGGATGLINYALSGDKAKAAAEAEERRRENYRGSTALLTAEQMAYLDTQPTRPAAGDRFRSDIPNVRFRWNAVKHEIEQVPA